MDNVEKIIILITVLGLSLICGLAFFLIGCEAPNINYNVPHKSLVGAVSPYPFLGQVRQPCLVGGKNGNENETDHCALR